MSHFNTIVLTTDLSENAEVAFAYAVELARKFGSTLHLVHVFEDPLDSGVPLDGSVGFNPTQWHAEKRASERLNTLALDLTTRKGVEVTPHLLRGLPAQEVLTFVTANHADCIVMSTHGRTGFSHLLFGSVAEKIVRLSPCPVLTVKPQKTSCEAPYSRQLSLKA